VIPAGVPLADLPYWAIRSTEKPACVAAGFDRVGCVAPPGEGRATDRARRARRQAALHYRQRANGGVMMHVADDPALYELRPKGDVPFHHVSTIAVSLRHARKRGV